VGAAPRVVTIGYDLRIAARTLWSRPGLAVPIILTLGLGMGLVSAMAVVVEGVLLRPLPYPAPDRLVRIAERTARSDAAPTSYLNFSDWREQSRSFEAMAGVAARYVTLTGGTQPVRAATQFVSADYFRVAGVEPLIGRGISAEENRAGGAPVVVVSERLWRETLGAPVNLEGVHVTLTDMLGRTESYAVVGVMPPGYTLLEEVDVYAPLDRGVPWSVRGNHVLSVVGRMRAGVALTVARAELSAVHARIREQNPDLDAIDVSARLLTEQVLGPLRKPLLLLLGAAGILLLMAFGNVAGALLARGIARGQELQVRAALGASRRRLVVQLLCESALLALPASVLAVIIANVLVGFFATVDPTVMPRLQQVAPSWLALAGCAAAVASLGVVSFGLGTALLTSRWSLDALRTRGVATRPGERAGWRALLSAEVTLAFMLLITAGLLGRSLWEIAAEDTGFDPTGVITVDLNLPQQKYTTSSDYIRYFDETLGVLRATPGVESAGLGNMLPLPKGGSIGGPVELETGPVPDLFAEYRVADEGYFDALRIRLLRGRLFEARDRDGAPHAVVINETLAQRLWGDADPLGRRFLLPAGTDPYPGEWLNVVGVVEEVRPWTAEAGTLPVFYVSYRQRPAFLSFTSATLLVRQNGVTVPTSELLDRLRALDPDVPLRVRTLQERLATGVADRNLVFSVLGVFAALALVLAGIGMWGVTSFVISRRVREVGIRLALGAVPAQVRRTLQADSFVPLAIGIVAGALLALAVTRWIRSLLFEVSGYDPLTVAAVVVILTATSWLASYLPARRTARTDPAVTLRSD
jgi:putative ABC transport system permease protein